MVFMAAAVSGRKSDEEDVKGRTSLQKMLAGRMQSGVEDN
jgi:hypothetical protein